MIKVVVGGQLDKKEIAKIVKDLAKDSVEVDIMNDLDAVIAVKNGQFDYYLGACATGSGGALAMAIAMLGSDKTVTVGQPGSRLSDEEIIENVNNGKIAFGFTSTYINQVVPIIIKAILNK